MARFSIDNSANVDKIVLKTDTLLRRKSTGNSSIQIKEPNYLKASTGSCHDFCKYGGVKPDFPVKPWRPVGRILNKNVNVSLDTSPGNDHRRKKALTSPKLMPVSSGQRLNELLKQNTFSKTDAFGCQPRRALLSTRSTNKRESRNDAGKNVKTPKKSDYPPLHRSSSPQPFPKAPTPKSRTSNNSHWKKVTQPDTKNRIENKNTTSYENVPEKIIHVVEQEDENQNKAHAQESNNHNPNQNQNQNSEKATTDARVIIPEENDTSQKKLKFKKGKVLVTENGNAAGSTERCLRRSVSEGKVISHKKTDTIGIIPRNQIVKWENTDSVLTNVVIEKRASNLVKMSRTKVEALVRAFESVISKTQHP